MEQEQDETQVPETESAETTEQVTETTDQITAEEFAALKEQAAKVEDLESKNKQLFERLKKKDEPETSENLSTKDILALIEAKVSPDDYEEVSRVAKILGKQTHEALKDDTLKLILETRAEQRRTANATQTRGSRGTTKVSGEDLLTKAEKTGEVPETDEGMQELFKARMARRHAQ